MAQKEADHTPDQAKTLEKKFRGIAQAGEFPEPAQALFRKRSVLRKRALQRSVLCKEACSAKKRALQRRVLCKEACSAKKRALQRSVLCKEACSAKKRALQRRVLCKEACSAKKRAPTWLELLQLFDSVEAKQYKRPDMNGDLRLGFASDDFAGTKWKNFTEMVTLDYWGVCKGFQARLDKVEAWQDQRGPKKP